MYIKIEHDILDKNKDIKKDIIHLQSVIKEKLELYELEENRIKYLRKNIPIGPYCKKIKPIILIGFPDYNQYNCSYLYRNEKKCLEYCLLYNEIINESAKTCDMNLHKDDNNYWEKKYPIEFIKEEKEIYNEHIEY